MRVLSELCCLNLLSSFESVFVEAISNFKISLQSDGVGRAKGGGVLASKGFFFLPSFLALWSFRVSLPVRA
jgi:hypothetical protein